MPRLSGLNAARMIKNSGIDTRVVILSIYKKDAYVYQAFLAGASGYVLKPTMAKNIIPRKRKKSLLKSGFVGVVWIALTSSSFELHEKLLMDI